MRGSWDADGATTAHPDRRRSVVGPARKGSRTKDVVRRAGARAIAVIAHRDLDGLAAEGLIRRGVAAVVNAAASISGRYPSQGAARLVAAGIPLIDVAPDVWEAIADGDVLEVDPDGGHVYRQGRLLAVGTVWTSDRVDAALRAAQGNLRRELDRFLENTLRFARDEKDLLIDPLPIPPLRRSLRGRHVLVVVRGEGYRDDLRTILHYIRDQRPVLIGVDGGADALLEMGLVPDIVIGDMDSVSDRALARAGQRVVHAYPGGDAPGLARVQALGLDAEVFPVLGTSEDAALLLAYEAGAELIVAVGTHTHVIDFLEKGRPGMASTLLARLKVGSRLVDAKGVRLLYRSGGASYLAHLAVAALTVAVAVLLAAPITRGLLRLTWLELRFRLGL